MLSVIICTYNRPWKVSELVRLLLNQHHKPDQIIVVDSSDEFNEHLFSNNSIDYIRSSHKNQPYQRYLGYNVAKHDWLLYLDDDMEPVDDKVTFEIEDLISKKQEAVAFALRFENVHEDTALAALPKSQMRKGGSSLHKFVRWFTAYPKLPNGKVGWNGVRGALPRGDYTEWFSGGAFLVRKSMIFQNFNFGLFQMFEDKIGKGEDLMISYSVAQRGKIWATEKVYFYHNDQRDSTYTLDVESFNRRVIYSRLFLSLEKARLTGHPRWLAVLIYTYYSFWRGAGLLVNTVIQPSRNRWISLRGFISGFLCSFKLIALQLKDQESLWLKRVDQDLK